MIQEEYKKKIFDLLDECNDRVDEAYKKAKEDGTLEPGIDGNSHIEREIEHEYHQKLLKLKEEYEETRED